MLMLLCIVVINEVLEAVQRLERKVDGKPTYRPVQIIKTAASDKEPEIIQTNDGSCSGPKMV